MCPLDGGEMVPLPDPMVGRNIAGRYVILEQVGAGGMGVVYRARHEVVGRDVALKFLSPELAYDPRNRTRFLREAKAANRIDHEHIIDITDYGTTDDGNVYLVMEFLAGYPLCDVVAQGPMAPRRVMHLCAQVASALGRAHALGVVHRDIKPDNLFLLDGYEGDFVKLLDFGLAHMKGELRVTATGSIFGTPEYMSPEQARGAATSGATDIYSFGVVLYEMLTGRLPFEGGSTDLLFHHLRDAPPPLRQRHPDVPEDLETLVLSLLHKEPTERMTALALAEAARAWIQKAPVAAPLPRSVAPPPTDIVRDTRPEPPSPAMVARRWVDREALFRTFAREQYGAGIPQWLRVALARFQGATEVLCRVGDVLDQRATEAAEKEEALRASRLRVGAAIESLAQDHARAEAALAEVPEAEGSARQEKEESEAFLAAEWESLPTLDQDPAGLTQLREMGGAAGRYLDAFAVLEGVESTRRQLQGEYEDLGYQLSQLRGRLAALSAGVEHDQEDLREATKALDAEWDEALSEVVSAAAPVTEHFVSFAAFRSRMQGSVED